MAAGAMEEAWGMAGRVDCREAPLRVVVVVVVVGGGSSSHLEAVGWHTDERGGYSSDSTGRRGCREKKQLSDEASEAAANDVVSLVPSSNGMIRACLERASPDLASQKSAYRA